MSDTPQPAQSAPNAYSEVSLDGGWFRRERERVALGRKRVAERIGITESRLSVLESRKQPVPTEWLPILAALEFRIPSVPSPVPAVAPQPADEKTQAPVQDVATAAPEVPPPPVVTAAVEAFPVPVPVPVPVSVPVSVPVPVSQTPAHADSQVPAATQVAPAVVAPSVVTPRKESVSVNPAPSSSVSKTPVSPSFFCGHWLRDRRQRSAHTVAQLAKELGCSEMELAAMEQHNIRLPLRFIGRLQKLSLLSREEAQVAQRLPSTSRFDGIWLERQRTALRMTVEQLGDDLAVDSAALRLIEEKSWPVPAAWLPRIAALQSARAPKSLAASAPRRSYGGSPRRMPSSYHASRAPLAGSDKTKAGTSAPQVKESIAVAAPSKETTTRSTTPTAPAAGPSATPVAARDPGLGASIVEGRISFGKRAGLCASDVLSLIAHDLLLAKANVPLSYDAVAAAMRVLLSHKTGAA